MVYPTLIAICADAVLTAISGVVVLGRMYVSHPRSAISET
jgi:hypothetical protein